MLRSIRTQKNTFTILIVGNKLHGQWIPDKAFFTDHGFWNYVRVQEMCRTISRELHGIEIFLIEPGRVPGLRSTGIYRSFYNPRWADMPRNISHLPIRGQRTAGACPLKNSMACLSSAESISLIGRLRRRLSSSISRIGFSPKCVWCPQSHWNEDGIIKRAIITVPEPTGFHY